MTDCRMVWDSLDHWSSSMAVMDLVRALDEVLVTARNDLLSPEDGQLLLTEFPKAARLIHNFLEIKVKDFL